MLARRLCGIYWILALDDGRGGCIRKVSMNENRAGLELIIKCRGKVAENRYLNADIKKDRLVDYLQGFSKNGRRWMERFGWLNTHGRQSSC